MPDLSKEVLDVKTSVPLVTLICPFPLVLSKEMIFFKSPRPATLNQEQFCPSKGHLVMSGDIFGCHNQGQVLLESTG